LEQRNGLKSNKKMRECKLRSFRSKWKKAGEQRQGNQHYYNNLQNWIGGKVEVKVKVKAEAPIIAMRAL